MLLYHGTAGLSLDQLLKQGLQPRGKRKGNFQHTVLSRKDAVYLSHCYAPYFLFAARRRMECGLVVEIDSNKIFHNLVPDEDALEQVGRGHDNIAGDFKKRTRWYRENLERWADCESWEKSVKALGNCAHLGPIPATAFTRIAVIPFKKNPRLRFDFDASINLLNHRILGTNYHWRTRWLFGDSCEEAPPNDLHSYKIDCCDVEVDHFRDGAFIGKKYVNREGAPPAIWETLKQNDLTFPDLRALES